MANATVTTTASADLAGLAALHDAVLTWYAANARELPWRRPDAGPWAVLVSEFMLQQTPVARVLPAYGRWLRRWPSPSELASDTPGEAVRAWGRLGYPRRALRLHATAAACVANHDGEVPANIEHLLGLPGVGRYTAAAVASFAFGQRHAVLDTNVRRVQARAVTGVRSPAPAATSAEWALAESLVPAEPAQAARWAVAVMELGALVCTARTPRCGECPIRARCAWLRAGQPEHAGPVRRSQGFTGTDRQCRGALLGRVRDQRRPVPRVELNLTWPHAEQRERALGSLVTDGLLERTSDDCFQFPTGRMALVST